MRDVFQLLTPLAIDPADPFPFIANLGLGLALQLTRVSDGEPMQALLLIPGTIARFIRLPGKAVRFLPLEQLIGLYLDHLFPGFTLTGRGMFRILRDSEVEIEEEAEDLVRLYESALKRRRRGHVIRLSVDESMPRDLLRFLSEKLDASPDDVFPLEGLLARRYAPAHHRRAPGPGVHPVQSALAGADPRFRRRLLRRDPAEGHHRPPPL